MLQNAKISFKQGEDDYVAFTCLKCKKFVSMKVSTMKSQSLYCEACHDETTPR